MNRTEEENRVYNTSVLEAWNEWKVICSIFGCSSQNKKMLKNEVGKAFNKKIKHLISDFGSVDYDECALEFDSALEIKAKDPGIDKRNGKEKEKKNYKDIAWRKVEKSSDPPLKVIRGMLLGGWGNKKAPLNAIVREYLENNFGIKHITLRDGTRLFSNMISFQDDGRDDDGDDNKGYEDYVNSLCMESSGYNKPEQEISSDFKEEIGKYVSANFSLEEAAVLIAEAEGISLTVPQLLHFVGKGKSMTYELCNEAKLKLKVYLTESVDPENYKIASDIFMKIFFSMLSSEKSAEEFLYIVNRKC